MLLKKWKILDSETVFDCKWFNIVKEKCKLPTGEIIKDYYVTNSADIVTIIPFLETNKLLVIEEYKHGYKDTIYTFPSGIMEKGEQKEISAKRELLEETGYKGKLEFIKETFPNPTSARFKKFTFIATELKKIAEQKLDKTEFLNFKIMTIKEIMDLIDKGRFVSDLSICSFYSALKKRNLLEIKT